MMEALNIMMLRLKNEVERRVAAGVWDHEPFPWHTSCLDYRSGPVVGGNAITFTKEEE